MIRVLFGISLFIGHFKACTQLSGASISQLDYTFVIGSDQNYESTVSFTGVSQDWESGCRDPVYRLNSNTDSSLVYTYGGFTPDFRHRNPTDNSLSGTVVSFTLTA